MTTETEAAADAPARAVVAGTVEADAGPSSSARRADHRPAQCPNCGSALTGAYCAACGQAAHIHRSVIALGHDILHSVYHFDGKLWRTMPELIFRPGRLTRRYIDGERAKFISPMALYLFTVFLMYAVFSFTGGPTLRATGGVETDGASAPSPPAAEEPELEPPRSAFSDALRRAIEQHASNPSLLTYKLETNGYKYSWALVPLSIPFVWLLFFWRKDLGLYDHAVFVTYSISFMMLLLIATSMLGESEVAGRLRAAILMLVPPLHLYRQLREAYGLSRAGALARLFLLLVAAAVVLIVFVALLFVIGALA